MEMLKKLIKLRMVIRLKLINTNGLVVFDKSIYLLEVIWYWKKTNIIKVNHNLMDFGKRGDKLIEFKYEEIIKRKN